MPRCPGTCVVCEVGAHVESYQRRLVNYALVRELERRFERRLTVRRVSGPLVAREALRAR